LKRNDVVELEAMPWQIIQRKFTMLTFADRDLSLEDLESVLTVSECGTFSRAGEALRRTQPAITRSVQNVEKSVETRLLNRAARPTVPTPAGEDFAYEVRRGLFFITRGLRKARCMGRAQNAMLEVGHTAYLEPGIVAYLSNIARSPNVGFSALYHSSWSAEIVANVRSGIWDCGFVVSPASVFDLEAMPILRDPLCVIMASDHPLARKRTVQLSDLENQRLILPARDRNVEFRSWFIGRCEQVGVKPMVVQEVAHPHDGVLLAAAKIGLAITNQSTARTMRKGSTVWRRLSDEDMAVEIQFVLRREARSQALIAFIRTVTKLQRRIVHPEQRKAPSRIEPQSAGYGTPFASGDLLKRA
jgi:DNA-binding transcriptional LysR family regulator